MKEVPQTFDGISKKFLKKISQFKSPGIDIVFDQYFTPSIKYCERLRRNETTSTVSIGPNQIRHHNFAGELKNTQFKEALFISLETIPCSSVHPSQLRSFLWNDDQPGCITYSGGALGHDPVQTAEDLEDTAANLTPSGRRPLQLHRFFLNLFVRQIHSHQLLGLLLMYGPQEIVKGPPILYFKLNAPQAATLGPNVCQFQLGTLAFFDSRWCSRV
ncbi:uncharacterized protein TNCV_2520931 [Trichonephila clavipes]|nr:uncharacterized protein TNCV_2520931 [Trichonephila clavipes]